MISWTLLATHVPADGQGGGIVRYTVELAKAFDRRQDVKLSLVTSREAKSFFQGQMSDEVDIRTVNSLPTVVASVAELVGHLDLRGSDVVQGVKHLVPRARTARTVLTVHDMLLLDRAGDFGRAKRTLLPRFYLDSIRRADRILCVSHATRERLLSYVPSARDRARVVHLAPLGGELVPQPVVEVGSRPFALVVGDASIRKNLDLVVSAWQIVREHHPEMLLVTSGPPAWGEHDSGGQAAGVLHLEMVSDAQLSWLYAHAGAVACPSLFEGFGLPAVEAFSFGAPVVTSEDPALCEAAPQAVHVYSRDVVAWADALERAMLGPRVKGSVSRTWDDVAEQTVAEVLR